MWPDFFLCPFHFRPRLGVWAFPSMPLLALCLMAPEGVTRRLNMGSRDTYTCQIKKNKGFVAWHLWDSWPGGWWLGRWFVVQVSVAAVKPRITKRTNGDYGAQREHACAATPAAHACKPPSTDPIQPKTPALWCRQRGHLGYFLIPKTGWWSLTGCSVLRLREAVERPGNEEGWPLRLTPPFVTWNWSYGFRNRSSTFSPPPKNNSGFHSHGAFKLLNRQLAERMFMSSSKLAKTPML